MPRSHTPGDQARARPAPLWLRLAVTAFVAVLVPVYWREYGPHNLLWFSDLALFLVAIGLWTGHPLPASMAAVGVLVVEVVWTMDFLVLLVTGSSALGVTSYMQRQDIPVYVRALSLFHLALPPVLIWMLHRFGYDRRGLRAQTLLAWIVLPLTFVLTNPEYNINLVFGPGKDPQDVIPPPAYLALMMIGLPLLIYGTTHLVLTRLFTPPRRNGA